MPIRTILVATDFGPHSVGAMEYAVEFALHLPVKVHLVHVKPATLPAWAPEPYLTTAAMSRDDGASAGAELRLLQRSLEDLGVICEAHMRVGSPAEELVALALELGVDSIVMGTRPASLLQRLLFGSVSEQVCRSAPCAVTVVRGGLGSAALQGASRSHVRNPALRKAR